MIPVAIITLAGVLLMVLKGTTTEQRIVSPIVSVVVTGIVSLAFYASSTNPNINRHYSIKILSGRLSADRKVYPPDPEGWRYVSGGVASVLMAVLMNYVMLRTLFHHSDEPTVCDSVVVATLILLVVGSFSYVEYRLKNK